MFEHSNCSLETTSNEVGEQFAPLDYASLQLAVVSYNAFRHPQPAFWAVKQLYGTCVTPRTLVNNMRFGSRYFATIENAAVLIAPRIAQLCESSIIWNTIRWVNIIIIYHFLLQQEGNFLGIFQTKYEHYKGKNTINTILILI